MSLGGSPVSASTPVAHTLESISALLDQKLLLQSMVMIGLRKALNDDMRSMIAAELNTMVRRIEEDFAKTIDFIIDEQKDLKQKIIDRDSAVQSLQSDQLRLQNEINNLSTRLSTVKKISGDHNIEIQLAPERHTKNVINIVKSIYSAINRHKSMPESCKN
ncbi:unnamed protein product [Diatraea saccharalis]|uniref:Uncharacterized protein n=1 Tax=Diatraea saccharalis TaxID=40085 RepID=A0A9N9N048_9NEOP|nr:unnamed protein product [Diatraea saccharalis]